MTDINNSEEVKVKVEQQSFEESVEKNNEILLEEEAVEASSQQDAEANETQTEENLATKQQEEVDYKAKFYYMAAELDNLQKRNAREREKLLKYGNEKVLSSLLEVVDNLERTIDSISNETDEKIKNIVTGIDMVKNQFLSVLKDNGLEEIKTVGEMFDPNFHEALAQQPAEGKKDQEILTEFQKGYVLNGRLLRAAKVVVAKNN